MAIDRRASEQAVDTLEDERPAFRAVRKGYDPDEVDAYVSDARRERDELVDELEIATDHNERLRTRLATAEAELQAHLDHAAAVAASPGTEGDRLVEAARTAALEIRTRAQIEANDLIKAANDEVRAVRADAEQLVVRRSREADEVAAARLREANEGIQHANEQADALLRQTQQRADASLEAARTRARSLVGEAEEARAVAVAEAAVIVHEAERRGRELIDEARTVRERIVGELTRRRAKLRAQVEQLQAGRDRMLDAFQVVRDALDEATVELEVVLPEARDAALDAAQRAATEPDPVLDQALARLRASAPHDRDELAVITGEHQPVDAEVLDEAGVVGADVDLDGSAETLVADADGYVDEDGRWVEYVGYREDASAAATEDEVADDADADPVDGEGAFAAAGEAVVVEDDEGAADAGASGSVLLGYDEGYGDPAPRRMALAPDPVEGRWSSAVRIIARPEPDADDAEDDEAEDDEDAAEAFAGDVAETADAADERADAPAGEDGADGRPTADHATTDQAAADQASADPSTADQAKHEHGVGTDAAPAATAPPDAEVPAARPSAAEPIPTPGSKLSALVGGGGEPRLPAALVGSSGRGGAPSAPDDTEAEALDPVAALEARRDQALAGPQRQLRRRLKGMLVEEENELLHAIRSVEAGVPKAHEVLPTEAVHRERIASAAQPGLLAATVAGQELGVQIAADETRRRVPGALPQQLLVRPEVDTDTVDRLAGELARELATELRARVAACFPVGPPASDDPRRARAARDELSTAVRSAYRGTKAGFVDRVCDRAISEALNRAVRAQIPAGVHPAGIDVRALFPVSAAPGAGAS